jgi:hypothetical protein
MFAVALFLFAHLGVTFIAPTGPGSGMPLFLTLLFPCGLFLIIGPRLTRILTVSVACACILGVVSEYRAKQRFGARVQARLEHSRREALEQHKRDTEQPDGAVTQESAQSADP